MGRDFAEAVPAAMDVFRRGSAATGLPDTQVADELSISPRTVHRHLSSIYSKLGVTTRTAAARAAIEHGLA